MCGIVGFQGEFSPELLARMTDAVAHRGPDGEGGVIRDCDGQPPTGLGHRRLAIIDLSDAGLQPMGLSCGELKQDGLTLVFNGEIYNYRELRADLAARGHRFTSASDSEVLLHLYEAEGPAMLGRLNGIFAFAIHDARERGRPDGVERGALFLARDPLGVKPLYFVDSPRGFLFGSEIKAILMDPSVERTIDAAALHQTLAYLWTPAPRTILRAVRKLEPGSAMIVSGGRIRRRWSYYTPPYIGQVSAASEADLAKELAERLYTAVDRQLVSDVPVGAFLSGGLDSSSIVAMMRRARPNQPITAFTIGFEDDEDTDGNPQDLPFARKVAAHLDVSLQEITLPSSAIHRLEEMIRLLDEPQADPAPINALMIAEASRAMGIPVLLSGAGGDDIFGGYRRHWALQFERNWTWMPAVVRERIQDAAQWAASGNGRGQSIPAVRRLAKMFAYAGEEPDRRLVSYFLWSTDQLRRGLYTPEFARETALMDVAEPLLRSLQRIPKEHDPLQRMLFLETVHFLADHNLNYTDRAGMAVGVEVRVPLLDLDLVKFAAMVPSSMKQAGRIGKPLFKKAMEPYLPHDVINRPKTGFGAPLRRWLRTELRDLVGDTLSPVAIRRRGFFEPAAVARLIDQDRRGRVDGSYTIFALLSFELWCRSFLDVAPRAYASSTSS
jgi:asparagine synthase (glutamine-hydrolysing)